MGVFTFGVRRAAWREPHRLFAHARREAAYRDAFLEAYRSQLPPEAQPGDLAIAFAEYLRLAQLWMWWQQPMHFRRRAEGIARALYSRPLLGRARARGLARLRRLAAVR